MQGFLVPRTRQNNLLGFGWNSLISFLWARQGRGVNPYVSTRQNLDQISPSTEQRTLDGIFLRSRFNSTRKIQGRLQSDGAFSANDYDLDYNFNCLR